MERRLQERLVGAILLVLAGVLLIPLFLDGPEDRPRETTTEPLALPGQASSGTPSRTVRIESPGREAPVRVSPARSGATDEAQAAETPTPARTASVRSAEPLPAPAAEPPAPQTSEAAQSASEPEPEPPAAAGEWAVQLGSFSSEDNAERLADEVRGRGFEAYVSAHRAGNVRLHRVRVGALGTRDAAESLAARLQAAGYPQAQPVTR